MLRVLAVLLAVSLVCGCSGSLRQRNPEEVSGPRVFVKSKHEAIEPRTTLNFWSGRFELQPQTVYYLYAENGWSVEVDRETYMTVEPGTEYASRQWKTR